MAYTKRGFKDGDVLYASQLIAMEDAIVEIDEKLNNVTPENGYTPVKGEDYWTEEDKAEIVDDTIAALEESGFSGGVQMNLLWENADCNSDFLAQTLALEKAKNYKTFGVLFIYQKDIKAYILTMFVFESGRTNIASASSTRNFTRPVTIGLNGNVTFGNCYYYNDYGSSTNTNSNEMLIPYKIYGISGINEEVSA